MRVTLMEDFGGDFERGVLVRLRVSGGDDSAIG